MCECVKNLLYKNVCKRTRKFLFIFLVEKKSCQNATMHSMFACFLLPSSLHSIFKQENSGKRSGKQSKPSFVFGTDLNDRPQEIEAVWKFSLALSFCTEGKKQREADSPHEAEAPRPHRLSFRESSCCRC